MLPCCLQEFRGDGAGFGFLRKPSLDFVFVSLTFRQPFVAFRQVSFDFDESGLFNGLRAGDAGKMCEPEGPAAYRFPRPARWRRPRSHVVLASPPLGACLSMRANVPQNSASPKRLLQIAGKWLFARALRGRRRGREIRRRSTG